MKKIFFLYLGLLTQFTAFSQVPVSHTNCVNYKNQESISICTAYEIAEEIKHYLTINNAFKAETTYIETNINLAVDKEGNITHHEVSMIKGSTQQKALVEEAIAALAEKKVLLPAKKKKGKARNEDVSLKYRFENPAIKAETLITDHTDDSIYKVVNIMPRFPGCEELVLEEKAKQKCANMKWTNFVYTHLKYPQEAKDNNIKGTVVVQFVVDKDGTIINIKTLRDIGGGCAEEAVRVIQLMNEMGIKWRPGFIREGVPVKILINLPLKFG